jgi:hypothetical protein
MWEDNRILLRIWGRWKVLELYLLVKWKLVGIHTHTYLHMHTQNVLWIFWKKETLYLIDSFAYATDCLTMLIGIKLSDDKFKGISLPSGESVRGCRLYIYSIDLSCFRRVSRSQVHQVDHIKKNLFIPRLLFFRKDSLNGHLLKYGYLVIFVF